MAYIVYKHTNKINGKVYIGITERLPEERWAGGRGYYGQYFYGDIEKYGWENFEHEILKAGLTGKEARKIEGELIEKYNSSDKKYGYNVSIGVNNKNKKKKSVFSFRADKDLVKLWRVYASACPGMKVDDLGTLALQEYIENHKLTGDAKAFFEKSIESKSFGNC